MRHLARHLALAACLTLAGSVAMAAPARKAKTAKKHRAPIEQDARERGEAESDEAPATTRAIDRRTTARERHAARLEREREQTEESVAFASPDDVDTIESTELVDAPVKLHVRAPKAKDWSLAIGPYVWASSVDANVSLGGASVGSGVDFMELKRHTRWGAMAQAELRYRQFSISGDAMYGVIGIDGEKTVGPLMVSLNGTASSLLVDGYGGYQVYGSDQSILALELRGGVRYQRTAIEGSVGLGGSSVASTDRVQSVADAVAGARIAFRPFRRIAISGEGDIGVFGDSQRTWSAAADASVRLHSRVMLSLGYRTLTMAGTNLTMRMHGPRAAIQLTF